ncbi:MAG: TlpA family protein disulfide reductase [Planctomycetes bacterium]|nr:TlpA family protein disulfide reductase [Planctomycetota bacterium]
MTPHLVRWADKYAKQGLVVLDIDNGRNDSPDALREHVQQAKLTFPVAHDVDGKTCEAYAIRGFPAAFLVGVDGKVIWEGFPLPEVEKLPAILEAELAKVKSPEKGDGKAGEAAPEKKPEAGDGKEHGAAPADGDAATSAATSAATGGDAAPGPAAAAAAAPGELPWKTAAQAFADAAAGGRWVLIYKEWPA